MFLRCKAIVVVDFMLRVKEFREIEEAVLQEVRQPWRRYGEGQQFQYR